MWGGGWGGSSKSPYENEHLFLPASSIKICCDPPSSLSWKVVGVLLHHFEKLLVPHPVKMMLYPLWKIQNSLICTYLYLKKLFLCQQVLFKKVFTEPCNTMVKNHLRFLNVSIHFGNLYSYLYHMWYLSPVECCNIPPGMRPGYSPAAI